MAQVTVNIAGNQYHISCDSGQEAQIGRLGRYLDQRSRELTAAIGPIQENMLLTMVGLLVADELAETNGELEQLRSNMGVDKGAEEGEAKAAAEESVVEALDALTNRIESIAERLENN